MADIIPFRAVRPRADLADRIAALPYDVYNRKEAFPRMGQRMGQVRETKGKSKMKSPETLVFPGIFGCGGRI